MHPDNSHKHGQLTTAGCNGLRLTSALMILCFALRTASGAETIARWVGGSGSWSDTNNWDIGRIPKNAGTTTFRAILDVAAEPVITISEPITVSGLLNRETLRVEGNGDLNVIGSSTNSGTITAAGGKVRFSTTTINGTAGWIIAETGAVTLTDTEMDGGVLSVTDDPQSQVRFAGDVTLKAVSWVDEGAGEFVIYNTSARLLGDYEHGLPAGYNLVVWSYHSSQETRLSVSPGNYQNDGLIELRHSGGGYSSHPKLYWLGSGALLGSGAVFLNYPNANEYERPWIAGETNSVLTVGAGQVIHGQGDIRLAVVNEGTVQADQKDRALAVTGFVDNHGTAASLSGGRLVLQGGLANTGSASVETNSSMSISGTVSTTSDLVSPAGASLELAQAAADLGGKTLIANGGIIAISSTSISNGTLRVTDNAQSQVRFSGDVRLSSVAWLDDGAGEFTIYNASARLLGDYESGLPKGYKLVVWSRSSSQETRLTVGPGEYQNEGLIELRHSGGGYSVHPKLYWSGSGALSGNGEVLFNYPNANDYERPWISGDTNAVLTVAAGQWIHGQGEIRMPLTNHGTVEADRKDRVLVISGLVDNTGVLRGINGGRLILLSGLANSGTVVVDTNSSLTISGTISAGADWVTAPGSTMDFSSAALNLQGKTLVADRGVVTLTDTVISNGTLRVTADPSSQVRFSGDVTFESVPWIDDGGGEFIVYNTSARLLGDYEHVFPSGYTLVVWSQASSRETRLTLPAGDFDNEGMIELRHSGGGYSVHPKLYWSGPGALVGGGEVFLNYANANDYERPWISGETNASLAVGSYQWLHGQGQICLPVLNQGTIEADRKDRPLIFTGVVHNTGVISAVSAGDVVFLAGITNQGSLNIEPNGGLQISGPGSTDSDLTAAAGATLLLDSATLNLGGNKILADSATVTISGSAIGNGTLQVTDKPNSQIRFSGDVTLTSVPWVDSGAGEFLVYNASARLLGDYAHGLPAGYKLIVWADHSSQETRLSLGPGEYQNNGVMELRQSGGGYSNHPKLYWLDSGALLGNGEVWLNYANANDYEQPWITGAPGATLTIGIGQWMHGQGEIHLALVNQGKVEADRKDRALVLTEYVNNAGILRAIAGGRLVLLKGITNAGLLDAAGGVVDLSDSIFLTDSGVLQTSGSGTIYLARHLRGDASALSAITSSTALVLDGAGVPLPDLQSVCLFVEAEDFNFDRGRYESVSDVMPYLGGAYQGQAGRDRIDYHQTDNRLSSDVYRVNEGPGVNVNIYALADVDRGIYRMTNNFKVSYNDAGDWYNYTRNYPTAAEPWYFFARVASGGRPSALQLDEVTGSANTTSQTLETLGEIRGPATGDWNRFAYLPLRAGTGEMVSFDWVGSKIFRASILDGGDEELDCFVFAPASSSGPAQLIEVMGQDLGPDISGFAGVSLNSLSLRTNSVVRLIDSVHNSGGTGAEALYIKNLTVPAGAVLDLNGLQLYAQQVQIAGTVFGGQVQVVTGERPLLSILALDGTVQISWPAGATGYLLQGNGDLTNKSSWQTVPGTPAQVGDRNVVTQSISAIPRFYRLIH